MDPPGGSNLVRENSENGGFSQPNSNDQQKGLVLSPDYEHQNHGYHQGGVYENPCTSNAYIPFHPDFQKGPNSQPWSEGSMYTNENCNLNTRQGQGGNSNTVGNILSSRDLSSTPEKSLAPTFPPFYGPQRPPHLASEDPQHYSFNPFIPVTTSDSNWSTQATVGWEETPEESNLPVCHYGHSETGYPTLENDSPTEGVGRGGAQAVNNPHNPPSQKRYRGPFSAGRRNEVKLVRARGACIRCQYLRMPVSTSNVESL